jgi:hypothetical protein
VAVDPRVGERTLTKTETSFSLPPADTAVETPLTFGSGGKKTRSR